MLIIALKLQYTLVAFIYHKSRKELLIKLQQLANIARKTGESHQNLTG